MNNRFALYGFLGAMVLALAISTVGCGGAVIRGSATPVTLSSGPMEADEMATVCDTYRARFQRTPVRLSDGTPVWCF